MSASFAASLFYLFMVPWICASIMYQILPTVIRENGGNGLTDPSGHGQESSGQLLATIVARKSPRSR